MVKTAKITTAEEWQERLAQRETKQQRDERHFQHRLKVERAMEDVRDDLMSLVKNSGISDEEIHRRNGPTPKTLQNNRDMVVKAPRMSTVLSTLWAIGKDLSDLGNYKDR